MFNLLLTLALILAATGEGTRPVQAEAAKVSNDEEVT